MIYGKETKLHFLIPDDPKMWVSITGKSVKSHAEMEARAVLVYDLYNTYWKEWINSPLCFLDDIELVFVEEWYKQPNINLIALHTKYTKQSVSERLKRAFRKMLRYSITVQDWFDLKHENERIIFLQNAPVGALGYIPLRGRNVLLAVGDTLFEIATTVGTELYKVRGNGKVTKKEIHKAFERVGLLEIFLNCKPPTQEQRLGS